MGWEKIGSAILLIGMLFFIYPRMRDAIKNGPKGTADDWKSLIIPIVGVVLFVIFLISMM